jgi:biopolymer transport protein ExbB
VFIRHRWREIWRCAPCFSTELSTGLVDIFGRPEKTRWQAFFAPPSIGHNSANHGDWRRRSSRENNLLSIIQAAGWPIWPLIICSIVALALVIERFNHLRPTRIAPAKLLDEVMGVTRTSLPSADVVNKLADNSVLGQVLATGLRSVIAEPRITEPALRQSFENAGRSAVHGLEKYLNTLGTIAAAAPLLGLFGTVVGMIEIFGSQAPGGGSSGANPQQLAHGISVALYNTAFGLMIAIPSLMLYRYFRGRVDEFQLGMELAAERMVPHLMRFAVRSNAA